MKLISDLIEQRDSLIDPEQYRIKPSYTDEDVFKINTAKRKNRVKVSFLKQVIAYLESTLTEEFIEKEIKRISKEIKAVNERFHLEVTKPFETLTAEKAAKKEFNKKYGIPHKTSQLKCLRFILK